MGSLNIDEPLGLFYKGNFVYGKLQGIGLYFLRRNGQTDKLYYGEHKENKFHGRGVLMAKDVIYEGHFR